MAAPDTSATPTASPDASEKKSDRRWLLLLLLFFLIVGSCLIGFYLFSAEVPDVVGMTEDDAREALEDAGFEVGDVLDVESAKVDPGEVAEQSAEAGRRLLKGTRVDLDVAVGDGVIGGDGDDGDDSSRNGGYDYSVDGDDADRDDEQVAGPGSAAAGGPYVPSVQNTLASAALSALRSAGYRPFIGGYGPTTAGITEGYVYYQSPAPGTPLAPGSAIELWVSTGAPHEDGYEGVPYPGPTNP